MSNIRKTGTTDCILITASPCFPALRAVHTCAHDSAGARSHHGGVADLLFTYIERLWRLDLRNFDADTGCIHLRGVNPVSYGPGPADHDDHQYDLHHDPRHRSPVDVGALHFSRRYSAQIEQRESKWR